MKQFRTQSALGAKASVASFEACMAMAARGERHPALKDFVNARNGHGWTMLTALADAVSVKGVGVLLEAGANPLLTNRNGLTARAYLERFMQPQGASEGALAEDPMRADIGRILSMLVEAEKAMTPHVQCDGEAMPARRTVKLTG